MWNKVIACLFKSFLVDPPKSAQKQIGLVLPPPDVLSPRIYDRVVYISLRPSQWTKRAPDCRYPMLLMLMHNPWVSPVSHTYGKGNWQT